MQDMHSAAASDRIGSGITTPVAITSITAVRIDYRTCSTNALTKTN